MPAAEARGIMANKGFGRLVVGMALVAATWSCAGQIRGTTVRTSGQQDATAGLAAASQRAASRVSIPKAESEKPAPAPAPEKTHLRRLTGKEMNRALVEQAKRIILAHHQDAFGTEIPFEIEGKRYVGRIERHYHPEGGPLKPWGFHHGCSLFVVEIG
jgi:hypothetical protein